MGTLANLVRMLAEQEHYAKRDADEAKRKQSAVRNSFLRDDNQHRANILCCRTRKP